MSVSLALAAVAAIGALVAIRPAHGDGSDGKTATHETMTYLEGLTALNAGNAHFVHDEPLPTDLSSKHRAAIAPKQHPYAVVLTCADSRVAPEHIFGAGLGELFVVRVAGNVVDPVVAGSIEYAVEHLHAHLIVVLGHSSCGAVAAKISPPEHASPSLSELLEHVHTGDVTDKKDLPAAIVANTSWQAEMLFHSPVIAEAIKLGQTKPDTDNSVTVHVYSGVYDLVTGEAKLSPVAAPSAVKAPSGH